MKVEIKESTLELAQGNIVDQETEAIVNAANKELAPGGGVAGAIHRAAGPKLWEECRKLNGCETGEAKITDGYDLKTSKIIHTVGPIYENSSEDAQLLKKCYLNSLKLAEKNDIDSISFPAISTGAFGYPIEKAAEIALDTVIAFLRDGSKISLVRFVLYNSQAFDVHQETLQELL